MNAHVKMLDTIQPVRLRALTMLNRRGDTTITWTADEDEKWTAIIQKKMDEGMVFWIIEPRMGGVGEKVVLKDAADAFRYRSVIPGVDVDAMALVQEGAGKVIKTPTAPAKKSRRSKSAAEVASSESVAVAPMRGG